VWGSVTFTVVQISEAISEEGAPPIEVRTNVAYAPSRGRAEAIALQLASVQPMHGPDEERGGWWARTGHGMRLRFVVERSDASP
jgi:hypothetical protein